MLQTSICEHFLPGSGATGVATAPSSSATRQGCCLTGLLPKEIRALRCTGVRCAVATRAVILCSGSKSKPQRLASRRSSSAVEATKLGLPCRAAQVHGRLLQGGCALSRIVLSLSFFLRTAVFVANRFFVVRVYPSASRAGTASHQSAETCVRSAANGFFRFIHISLRQRSRNWTRAGFAVALCRPTSRLRLSVLLTIGCARWFTC